MIGLILSATAVYLLWYYFVRPLNHFRKLGVPTGNPVPVFGDQFQNVIKQISIYDWFKSIYDRHPGKRYAGFYQFTAPVLMLRDPELIKQIAVKDFDHFTDHKVFGDVDDPLWAGNLFLLKGQKWRDMRATLSGSYTSSKMKNMFGLMNEAAYNFVHFFVNKEEDILEVELKDTFTRYTNDVIATTAFGIKVDSLNDPNNEFFVNGTRITNRSGFINIMKFFSLILFPKLLKIFNISVIPKDATDFLASIIEETIKTREEKGIVRQDMINQLLEARRGKDTKGEEPETDTGFATVNEQTDTTKVRQIKKLTNTDIKSQALVFFFAGFDTISTELCFAAYELVVNPDVQDRLRAEINETWKATNGKITYEILLKMKYLDMVISETLRKWPAVSGVNRAATKPYIIEPATPDERPLPLKTGDVVFLPVLGLHRDPDHYPDPDKFDPERFNDDNKDNIKPYTYLPFGSGPRSCIGSRFALLEVKALLFHLLLNFYVVRSKKTRIPLQMDKRSLGPTQEGGFWFGLKRIHTN